MRFPSRPILTCLSLLLAACSAAPESPIRFEEVATGLDFEYFNGMTGRMTFPEITGGGVATLDYDLDGDSDLYLAQGQHIHGPPDLSIRDRLYRNDSGVLRDVTESSQIRATGYGMGVAVGDVNNDGYPDTYATNWGPNQLWVNNGDGTFRDGTQAGVTDDRRWSVSAAFGDLDGDGWQDLVVVNYVDYSLENEHPCTSALSGRRDYCGPSAYPPTGDRVLRNRGDGTFEDVTLAWGLGAARGAGLGVAIADFDGDGANDIFVANDGADNALWINQGLDAPFRFVDEGVIRGAAANLRGMPEASMGIAVDDFTGDGAADLILTHLNGETNTLYTNDGAGHFLDATRASGIGPAGIGYTGFGIVSRDFDRDGIPDLFVANGDVRILPEQLAAGDPLPLRQPNQVFRGAWPEGGAPQIRFSVVDAWTSTPRSEVTRGVASADFDGDGRMDVVESNLEGPARIHRNVSPVSGDWVGIRLAGPAVEGAVLEVGAQRAWYSRDGSYASSNDLVRIFSVSDPGPVLVRILWTDGKVERRTVTNRNQWITLERQ